MHTMIMNDASRVMLQIETSLTIVIYNCKHVYSTGTLIELAMQNIFDVFLLNSFMGRELLLNGKAQYSSPPH